jgi:hypothetical protein
MNGFARAEASIHRSGGQILLLGWTDNFMCIYVRFYRRVIITSTTYFNHKRLPVLCKWRKGNVQVASTTSNPLCYIHHDPSLLLSQSSSSRRSGRLRFPKETPKSHPMPIPCPNSKKLPRTSRLGRIYKIVVKVVIPKRPNPKTPSYPKNAHTQCHKTPIPMPEPNAPSSPFN